MSTFFERYLGVVALSFLALTGVFFGLKSDYPRFVIVTASLIFIIIFIISFIFFVFRKSFKLNKNSFKNKIGRFFFKYYKALEIYRKFSFSTLNALLLSFLFQFFSIIYVFFIAKAVGVPVDIVYLFLVVPLITLFLMLPISINGIGLRETAFILFFTSIGISSVSALAVSFLSFVVLIIISAFGGVVFLLNK